MVTISNWFGWTVILSGCSLLYVRSENYRQKSGSVNCWTQFHNSLTSFPVDVFCDLGQNYFMLHSLYLHHHFTEIFKQLISLTFARYLVGVWCGRFFSLTSVFFHIFFIFHFSILYQLTDSLLQYLINCLIIFTSIILILLGNLLNIFRIHTNIMVKCLDVSSTDRTPEISSV